MLKLKYFSILYEAVHFATCDCMHHHTDKIIFVASILFFVDLVK